MRIIAGRCKGRKLRPLKGNRIRPTTDRVREAIFNILGPAVQKARVLDLFAGTGALGLEALSRGAHYALFIDNHRNALETIRHNIHLCGAAPQARVRHGDISRALACITTEDSPFDLLFMDPPYRHNLIHPTLTRLLALPQISPRVRVVIEHDPTEEVMAVEGFLSAHGRTLYLENQRRYGKTLVSFLNGMI